MIPIAPHITAFLQQRLPIERLASPNTCDSYAYSFKLLFEYASNCVKIPPSQLQVEHLDASLIVNFLSYLETTRGNGAGSRNIQLAAIKSFMHFMEFRVPSARNRSNAFWQSLQREPLLSWSRTSPLKRCKPFWMPLTPLSETASVTVPCFIFASPQDYASLN
jgi:site-specific recombinase XerD